MNKAIPRTNAFAKKVGSIMANLASQDIHLTEAADQAQKLIDEEVGDMENEIARLTKQLHMLDTQYELSTEAHQKQLDTIHTISGFKLNDLMSQPTKAAPEVGNVYEKKKPRYVSIQWTGKNWPAVAEFVYGHNTTVQAHSVSPEDIITLTFPTGQFNIKKNMWLVRSQDGVIQICTPELFSATYQAV